MKMIKTALISTFLLGGLLTTSVAQDKSKTDKSTPADSTILDESKEISMDNIPVVSLDENDIGDANVQNTNAQANSYRDVFYSAARYNYSIVHFRLRGYNSDMTETFMNGVSIENLDNGFTPFGLWGGLSNITRFSENDMGLQPNKYGFGSFGGVTNYDARAFKQRKQTNFHYSLSNRVYDHNISLSKSTGFNKKGWAFCLSGSRRWSTEGYSDGTYMNSWSAYLGIDKKFNERNTLSLVGMYAPTQNGRQGTTTQEMYDIAGSHYYNPLWGYQNGKKRNSSITNFNEPLFILTHDWKINPHTSLVTAGSYIFGTRSTTGLDWYNAPDPRPDYYKYLPSYQDESVYQQSVLLAMQRDVNLRQVNWDGMYNSNRNSYEVVNDPTGLFEAAGNQSHYIVEERFTKTSTFNFNSTLNTTIGKSTNFSAGLSYQGQNNNYYKEVNDLLGGDFYLNLNQFAERDFPATPYAGYNNLNSVNTIVKKGDRFGYDYNINFKKGGAWTQAVFKLKRVNLFVAAHHTVTSFYRYGNYKNGLFPENSFGKSTTYIFYNYGVKGGMSYLVNHRNYFYINGSYMSKAPYYDKIYLSPRTRDFVNNNLQNERDGSVEAGYEYTAPKFKFRVTGYYTKFTRVQELYTFYDDLSRSFGNFSISNINKEHKGIETGAEILLTKGLTLQGAAAIGENKYTNRPDIIETLDNTSAIVATDKAYLKNFLIPGTQLASSIGLQYRSTHYWSIGTNLNYFDEMWANFNPFRRTYSAVEGILNPNSQQWHSVIDQTKLPNAFTWDMHANWSWKMNNFMKGMRKNTFMTFSLTVSNILNNTDIVSYENEQFRYDYQNKTTDKFPNKLSYAYGRTFNLGIGLRF